MITGRAKAAAKYPKKLCQAICEGLRKELKKQRQKLKCLMTVKAQDKVQEEKTAVDRSKPTGHEEDAQGEV